MTRRIELERRTLLLIALALACLAVPVVNLGARVSDGLDTAVRLVGSECAVTTPDGARIEVRALQGAQLACRELLRTEDEWDMAKAGAKRSGPTACVLVRNDATLGTSARVRGAQGAAVCDALATQGWHRRD